MCSNVSSSFNVYLLLNFRDGLFYSVGGGKLISFLFLFSWGRGWGGIRCFRLLLLLMILYNIIYIMARYIEVDGTLFVYYF